MELLTPTPKPTATAMKRLLLAAALLPVTLLAKDTRWASTSDPYWETGDWSNGMPGSLDFADGNLDTAYFSDAGTVPNVLLQHDIYLGRITFNQRNAAPENFVIGEPDGPSLHFIFTGGYYENHCMPGDYENVVETIAAPMKLYSSYQFYSDATSPTSYFVLGDISAGTTGTIDCQLKGVNIGANEVRGVISDGAGKLQVTKLQAGTWTLSGANTFSGVVSVSVGTLIAGDDVPATGPGPFGANDAANAVRLGYANPASAAWAMPCRILAGTKKDGTPVTIAKRIDIQTNNKIATWPQDTILGGANTNGTSRFTGVVSNYRPLFLQCATGGRCAFEASWSLHDRPVIIGYPDAEGTVALVSNLSTAGGLIVSNGTLEVVGTTTSSLDIPVSAGATVLGTGTLRANLVAEAGAILSGGTNGVGTLTINGNATLASGAILSLPAKDTEAPFLSVTGELSLNGAMLQAERFASDPVRRIVAVHAEGGIVGTPNLTALPKVCSVDITETDIVLSFRQPTKILIL